MKCRINYSQVNNVSWTFFPFSHEINGRHRPIFIDSKWLENVKDGFELVENFTNKMIKIEHKFEFLLGVVNVESDLVHNFTKNTNRDRWKGVTKSLVMKCIIDCNHPIKSL